MGYDRESAQRTQVLDDQSDFFEVDANAWLSHEVRAHRCRHGTTASVGLLQMPCLSSPLLNPIVTSSPVHSVTVRKLLPLRQARSLGPVRGVAPRLDAILHLSLRAQECVALTCGRRALLLRGGKNGAITFHLCALQPMP